MLAIMYVLIFMLVTQDGKVIFSFSYGSFIALRPNLGKLPSFVCSLLQFPKPSEYRQGVGVGGGGDYRFWKAEQSGRYDDAHLSPNFHHLIMYLCCRAHHSRASYLCSLFLFIPLGAQIGCCLRCWKNPIGCFVPRSENKSIVPTGRNSSKLKPAFSGNLTLKQWGQFPFTRTR